MATASPVIDVSTCVICRVILHGDEDDVSEVNRGLDRLIEYAEN